MGTSGITHFHEKGIDSPVICHVYKQSDGYPDSLGEQIREALGDASLVNGIRFDLGSQVNGMGCAAAQFIATAKTRVGGIYMISSAPSWADYDYHVYHNGEVPSAEQAPANLRMRVVSGSTELWDGELHQFDCATLFDDDE